MAKTFSVKFSPNKMSEDEQYILAKYLKTIKRKPQDVKTLLQELEARSQKRYDDWCRDHGSVALARDMGLNI